MIVKYIESTIKITPGHILYITYTLLFADVAFIISQWI